MKENNISIPYPRREITMLGSRDIETETPFAKQIKDDEMKTTKK